MKTSIFLTSFFSMNCSGSNPLTSAAICAAYPVMSNRVTRVTPDVPASSACQVAAVPMPSDDTSPMPVMTTRLSNLGPLFLSLGVRVDVVDRFLDAGDLLGVLVRDLDPELFLEGHHELHRVERVGAQVVHEGRIRGHFLFIDAKLFHDDALHLVCNRHLSSSQLVVDGWWLVVSRTTQRTKPPTTNHY